MKLKRFFIGMAAALLAAILLFPCEVKAISAEKSILIDAQTGHIISEHRANERSLIASTTKIMTALIVCEQCNVLDRMRIPKEAVGIEGSSMYLQEGEVLTLQELLYGLMLRSGNDAAVALAIYCGGTVEGFASLMNDKAKMLGMTQSRFANPHGLDDPGHYSTAHDMAKLSAYAMQNPIFRQTVSTKSVNISGRSLNNHNKLLWRLEGADGVKTGYTKAAGRILVSSAVRQGRRLVAVTINAPDDWNDHERLINDGFASYSVAKIVDEGDCLGEVEVMGGNDKSSSLLASGDYYCALALWEEVQIVIPEMGPLYAPVVQGQSAGVAYICIEDTVIGKIPLVYGKTIEQPKEKKRSLWQRIFGNGVNEGTDSENTFIEGRGFQATGGGLDS